MKKISLTLILLSFAFVSGKLLADDIPDLTKGGKPMSCNPRKDEPSIDWALGPLGLNGWGYSRKPYEGGSKLARQLLITRVDKKGPSKDALKVGDVIIGVDGKKFSHDVRKALAAAINQAETEEAGGKLNLLVWHPAKDDATTPTVSNVLIKIPVLGTYSATAPFNCPKTERIIDNAVTYMIANKAKLLEDNVFGCVNALGLMATGRDDVMPMVRDFAHSLILKPGETLSVEQHVSMASWYWGYRALFLSEYYLRTKDQAVLPTIDEYVTKLAMGQSGAGTWGHTYAARENTGYLHGPLGGYGALNQAGLTCMMALVLGNKCGVENQEVLDAIKRGNDFFAYYIGKGTIPYGDGEPYATFDDNGRSGQGAILFDLMGNEEGKEFYSELVLGDAPRGRDFGHTGCYWSHLWGGIGAARAGDKVLQAFMKEMDYIFTLERQYDGHFVYQGNTGAYTRKDEQLGTVKDKMDCTGARLLQLCVPRRVLYLTGKQTPKETQLPEARVDQILRAGRLRVDEDKLKTLTKDEIVDLLKDPLPAIRSIGVEALETQKINMVKDLITRLDDGNPNVRYGAAQALRVAGFQSRSAVKKLITIIEKSDDTRLRVYAINALWTKYDETGLNKVAGDAIPVLLRATVKHSDDDPRQVVQFIIAKALFNKYGLLRFHKINDEDRHLLVPAVKEWLANQNAEARQLVSSNVYNMLNEKELTALWKDIYHASRHIAPSVVGRAGEVRTDGIVLLAKHHVKEGMNLAAWYMRWQRYHGHRIRIKRLVDSLESYGAHARPLLPYLEDDMEYFKSIRSPASNVIKKVEKREKAGKKPKKDQKYEAFDLMVDALKKIRTSNDYPKLISIADLIDRKDIPYSEGAAKPIASAGESRTVKDADGDGVEIVALDGSGSKDAEGVIVAYMWTEVPEKGPSQEIARGPRPTVSLGVGVHTLTLKVYDTDGYFATDTVTITITK